MCFGDNAIIITEGRLDREDSAGIKFILLDDTTEHVEFNFTLPSQESSPFGLYEVGNKVFCSDHGSHCVFELNINSRDVLVVAGRLDANGTDDGPVETAYICSPSGLASRGECLYLNKFSQYFGNLAKAVMRSHNKKCLSKASKIFVGIIRYSIFRSSSFMLFQSLIKTLCVVAVVYISRQGIPPKMFTMVNFLM